MKAVLLCGGKGTRMWSLTLNTPKSLVPISGKPVLEHIMDHYAKFGINDFILCLGHLGPVIRGHFSNVNRNYKITMVDTGLNTKKVERLLMVKNLLDSEFLVSYSDDISDIDIKKLIEFHKKENKIASLTAVKINNPYGVLELNEFEPYLVTGFKEKPPMQEWINGGYFVFNMKIFDYIKEGDELEKEVLGKLAKEKQLAAYRHNGFWKSMNTEKDYLEFEEIFKKGGQLVRQ